MRCNSVTCGERCWGLNPGAKREYLIPVAIGAILCLGSLFLLLASYQVLPHGLNSISKLGLSGHLLGYGALAIGTINLLVGPILKLCSPKKGVYIRDLYQHPDLIDRWHENAHYWKTEEGKALKIEENEVFVELIGDVPFSELGGDRGRLFLPASFLRQKKEGETIRIQYKGELLELICNQSLRDPNETFDHYLTTALQLISFDWNTAKPDFSWLSNSSPED